MRCSREEASTTAFDLVVVGTGPAGLICALEYARHHPEQSLLLVEYGEIKEGEEQGLDDRIRVGNLINHHPPLECTNKGFGGTSQTWGGRCVNYDSIDFEPLEPTRSGCTWEPALFQDVSRFLGESARYFEIGEGVFSLHSLAGGGRYTPIAEGFKEGEVTDSTLERWSMPTRFNTRYLEEVLESKTIRLLENAEVQEIDGLSSTQAVTSVRVRDRSTGALYSLCASRYVLAMGAQEITRFLLKSRKGFPSVAGDGTALGSFYQGHISGKIASVQFSGNPAATDYGFLRDRDGTYVRRRFQFTPDAIREKRLLNTAIWLDNPLYVDPSHRSGAMSFMYLAMITPWLGRRLAPPAVAFSITKGKVNGIGKHLWNIVRQLPGSLWIPASIFYRRYFLKRKLPGVFLYSSTNRYALHFHSEQSPLPENSMRLGPDGDVLEIQYDVSEADAEAIVRAHAVLDSSLKACGCGHLEYWYPDHELVSRIRAMSRDGVHQVGTTRISKTAESGVVDSDLKVWGTTNCYVCSSSVFPTSGQANPTFFLGAFAVRLARAIP